MEENDYSFDWLGEYEMACDESDGEILELGDAWRWYKVLRQTISNGKMNGFDKLLDMVRLPGILLEGPAGTGKNTLAVKMAFEYSSLHAFEDQGFTYLSICGHDLEKEREEDVILRIHALFEAVDMLIQQGEFVFLQIEQVEAVPHRALIMNQLGKTEDTCGHR